MYQGGFIIFVAGSPTPRRFAAVECFCVINYEVVQFAGGGLFLETRSFFVSKSRYL